MVDCTLRFALTRDDIDQEKFKLVFDKESIKQFNILDGCAYVTFVNPDYIDLLQTLYGQRMYIQELETNGQRLPKNFDWKGFLEITQSLKQQNTKKQPQKKQYFQSAIFEKPEQKKEDLSASKSIIIEPKRQSSQTMVSPKKKIKINFAETSPKKQILKEESPTKPKIIEQQPLIFFKSEIFQDFRKQSTGNEKYLINLVLIVWFILSLY